MDKSKLFFDTETTGVLLKGVPLSDPQQPKLLQFGAILENPSREIIFSASMYIFPYWKGEVPKEATKIHGITREKCEKDGVSPEHALEIISMLLRIGRNGLIAHNFNFDAKILQKFFQDNLLIDPDIQGTCTMLASTKFCGLAGNHGLKWPKLEELYKVLFNDSYTHAHDALADVKATRHCYHELINRGVIK